MITQHEIIIINDNSSDKTRDVVERLKSKDRRIKLINRSLCPNGVGRVYEMDTRKSLVNIV